MNRTLKDQLKEWKREYQEVTRNPQKRRRERLTERDIKYLMGMNRAVYVRGKGGAYKQRG